jgi:hypothetical protein
MNILLTPPSVREIGDRGISLDEIGDRLTLVLTSLKGPYDRKEASE